LVSLLAIFTIMIDNVIGFFWFSLSIGTLPSNGTEGLIMFYQVKVLDKEGKLKKVITSNELSKRYWNSFFDDANGDSRPKATPQQNRKKKKELEIYFDHYCSAN
jgi:hypothetical protein